MLRILAVQGELYTDADELDINPGAFKRDSRDSQPRAGLIRQAARLYQGRRAEGPTDASSRGIDPHRAPASRYKRKASLFVFPDEDTAGGRCGVWAQAPNGPVSGCGRDAFNWLG